MNKILLIGCLLFFTINAFGQQFSQYNTGTVYESFENPSQRAFIPDTTRQFAFNFFLPTFNANAFLGGNSQTALKTRLFDGYYNTGNLQVGKGRFNYFNANASAYAIMLKMYSSFKGDQELGFFVKSKVEGRGVFSDESVAIFNGPLNFPDSIYNNTFNDNFFFQAYHQIGFTFRQQVNRKLSFGIKLSALSGIYYTSTRINSSHIVFDKPNDSALAGLQGVSYESKDTASVTIIDKMGLAFRNPGVAISAGVTYINEDGYKFQYNIKDLGFIHWNKNSAVKVFQIDTIKLTNLSSTNRETTVTGSFDDAAHSSYTKQAFNTKTNGLAEISVNKTYAIGYDRTYTISPTLILSKELFYPGFTAALVAPINHKSVTLSLVSSYNDLKMLNIGGQFLLKKDNSEFFIGSEKLIKTASFVKTAIRGTGPQTQEPAIQSTFTGMDFFIGCSFKFGPLIERRMNSSRIPMDERNFFDRLYDRIFKPKD